MGLMVTDTEGLRTRWPCWWMREGVPCGHWDSSYRFDWEFCSALQFAETTSEERERWVFHL